MTLMRRGYISTVRKSVRTYFLLIPDVLEAGTQNMTNHPKWLASKALDVGQRCYYHESTNEANLINKQQPIENLLVLLWFSVF